MSGNTLLSAGDRIRLLNSYGCKDYTVEEFRQCLGVFLTNEDRQASYFTPLCQLWGAGPDSHESYISNYGTYPTNEVPLWMNIPAGEGKAE